MDTGNVTVETEKITEPDEQDGKLTNELSRRDWADADVVAEPTLVSGDSVIHSYYYGEGDSRSCTIVDGTNSIEAFKTSATTNGGFYIGRYEQGTGNVCKAGVDAYVDVTRDEAKTAAEAMYSGNSEIKATTQLISSYAWDTVLNFICQTNTDGYTLATTTSSSYGNINTGSSGKTQTGEYTEDNYSNIHDLLGNCWEWTTEYSGVASPSVSRGGFYLNSSRYAAYRIYSGTSGSNNTMISFRSQLYV